MTTISTLLSLTNHFNPEIQSKFTTIVGLANISGPAGYMPDDVISIILGYTGDIDVKTDEMEILKNTIKRIRYSTRFCGTRLDGSGYTHILKSWRLYCVCCDKIFVTDSFRIAFNHCLSKKHCIKVANYGFDEINYTRIDSIKRRLIHNENYTIIKFRIQNEIYPDSWKHTIRRKRADNIIKDRERQAKKALKSKKSSKK